MQTRAITLIAAVTVLSSGLAIAASSRTGAAAGQFNAPRDVAAITALEDVLQTETDMARLAELYAPDATVLDIYAPGIYRGRDQIVAGFAPQLAAVRTMRHRMSEMNVATDGTFACAAMQIHFDTTLKNGTALRLNVRELDAFKKVAGQWRIVQQHVSLPVDAPTGAAVTDGAEILRGPIAWSPDAVPGPATSPARAMWEIRHWMEVGGASTSLDMLMDYYGPGDDVLVYDSFYPGELRGRGEIRRYYAALMNSYSGISLTMPDFAVDSDGRFGVQIDTQRITLKMKDGSTRRVALRQNDCMRRVGSRWYSFMEMISFAVDPKTNRGIMDFKASGS